ncbi:hypothetical protein J2S28_005430 [Rhizobium sp. SLBN-94]|jgi:hypothetical protein|nr:hypothetical protein [Rhizobium sp. SLBN-94]
MEETRHDPALDNIRCVIAVMDGVEIATPRQLASVLGNEDALVWNRHEGHMDWCLCAINIAESLRGSGMTARDQGAKLLIERTAKKHV